MQVYLTIRDNGTGEIIERFPDTNGKTFPNGLSFEPGGVLVIVTDNYRFTVIAYREDGTDPMAETEKATKPRPDRPPKIR